MDKLENGRLTAVIFDFDGTLADLPVDWAGLKRELGDLLNRRPLPPLADLLSEKGRSGEIAERLVCEHECAAAKRAVPFPWVKGVVAGLAERKVPLGIFSRNSGKAIGIFLERNFPGVEWRVVGREGTGKLKPDKAHLLAVLGKIGLCETKGVIVLGDAEIDRLSAENAGIRFLLVGKDSPPRESALFPD